MVNRVNKACRFFPCHKGLEDCTFCYCPFYPCSNAERGYYIYSPKLKKKIWSCENCNWIHKKKVVDSIFALIRSDYHPEPVISRPLTGESVKTGIVILGHGSRRHKANRLISEIVKIIKNRKICNIVEPSYLQLYLPDLPASIKKVIKKGCRRVIIVPFFLFNGNHVKRDIPQAIKKAVGSYPGVKFVVTKSLGEDAKIGEIVIRNINKAMK